MREKRRDERSERRRQVGALGEIEQIVAANSHQQVGVRAQMRADARLPARPLQMKLAQTPPRPRCASRAEQVRCAASAGGMRRVSVSTRSHRTTTRLHTRAAPNAFTTFTQYDAPVANASSLKS